MVETEEIFWHNTLICHKNYVSLAKLSYVVEGFAAWVVCVVIVYLGYKTDWGHGFYWLLNKLIYSWPSLQYEFFSRKLVPSRCVFL